MGGLVCFVGDLSLVGLTIVITDSSEYWSSVSIWRALLSGGSTFCVLLLDLSILLLVNGLVWMK
ncbi:hypothetical protein EON65_09345 [archaeon]|nr:MAG: hypothetical protein EON65_09345 [archaeon]